MQAIIIFATSVDHPKALDGPAECEGGCKHEPIGNCSDLILIFRVLD